MQHSFNRDDALPNLFGRCHCAVCGSVFIPGDDICEVKATGDMIHASCFDEYTAENEAEFLRHVG